jgi:hypothetical protein
MTSVVAMVAVGGTAGRGRAAGGEAAALTERLVDVLRSAGPDPLSAVAARLSVGMRAGGRPARGPVSCHRGAGAAG